MTIAQTIKRMPTAAMNVGHTIPQAGEIIMDVSTNRIKIGDGKTELKDLPWVSYGVAPNKEETTLDERVKRIIEDNMELIEQDRFNELYDKLLPDVGIKLTQTLRKAGIDPIDYLFPLPAYLIHDYAKCKTFEWNLDTYYTKSEIDAKLHDVTEEFTKKMFGAMGIPSHLMNTRTGE